MTRPRRLTLLTTSSGSSGGADNQVRDLALALRGMGWEVSGISMLPIESGFESLDENGIRVTTLGMRRGVPDPRGLFRLAARLREWRPDVLHSHMVHANLLGRSATTFVRVPVMISTVHNENEGGRWLYRGYRLTDRFTTTTTAVSEAARAGFIRAGGASPDRVQVVPNGVDLASFHPDEKARAEARAALGLDGSFTWLAAGRLVPAKDFGNLAAAFALLEPERTGAKLLIAGDGPLEEELRASFRQKGIDGAAVLLGPRSDMADLMRAADGFVMSSVWEGLPMVLLEAGATALPVVATDVGGNREAIADRESGLIVTPRSPEALAAGMQEVMDASAAERAAMGAAGRRHVQRRYALESVAAHWDRLYRAELDRVGSSSGG